MVFIVEESNNFKYYRDEDTDTIYRDNIDLNLKLNGYLKCKNSLYNGETIFRDPTPMNMNDFTGLNSNFNSTSTSLDDLFSGDSFSETDLEALEGNFKSQDLVLMIPSPGFQNTGLNSAIFDLNGFTPSDNSPEYNFNMKQEDYDYDAASFDIDIHNSPPNILLNFSDDTAVLFPDNPFLNTAMELPNIPSFTNAAKVDLSPKKSRLKYAPAMNPPKISQVIIETFSNIIYNENKNPCHHCDTKFSTLYDLINHYEKLNLFKNLKYKCVVGGCPFKTIGFHRKVHLRKHLVSEHCCKSTKKVMCDVSEEGIIRNLIYFCDDDDCAKVFYRRDTLQRHKRAVHGYGPKKN